ncbi:MAG: AGE family epimerase/isomerase, partial [Chloroflexota bacterium]
MMFHGEVYDREWNGFFRYATRRDWSEPHYEKMLEDNAGLLRNALLLLRISGSEEHADIARGVIEYVESKLRDHGKGYFYGSQDADEEFYKLNAEQRKEHREPYIDRTCYVGWNAQMISAYFEAYWTLDRRDLLDAALGSLTFLWENCRDAETGSMYRYHDGSPHVTGLLGDQAHVARALLDAAEATGDPKWNERAAELASLLDTRFRDEKDGGFFDVWDVAPDVGRLRDRQKSIQDNAVCAEVFTRLYHLTREEKYNDIARSTLESFAASVPQMGYFAAAFAKQVDLLLHPPAEVSIVGEPSTTREMLWCALSLYVPFRIVQSLEPARDAERLAALSLPANPSPAAYVCVGTTCSAPVTDPDSLIETVRRMAKDQQVAQGD